MAIEHLVLHHPEERFHYAVVDAVPFPGHRLDDAFLLEPPLVIAMLVLPAHVAMEDQPFQIGMLREGLVQHPLGLLQVRGQGQVPRHDVAHPHVNDRGQIRFAERAVELGDVRRPFLVRPIRREVPVDEVARDMADLTDVGMVLLLPSGRSQAEFGHQSEDFLMVDQIAAVTELRRYPSEAVSPFVLEENVPDQIHRLLVFDVFVGLMKLKIICCSREGSRFKQFGKLPFLMNG